MNKIEEEFSICEICGVKAARTVKRPQVLGRGEKMVLVDNVPVIACKHCGESYMTSETMHKLDKLRTNEKEAIRKIDVAEFV